MLERMCDSRANSSSAAMLGVFLALNLGSHFDIDLRQGLQLGAANDEAQYEHGSIHVQSCHTGR
jgi:hypothetical protein